MCAIKCVRVLAEVFFELLILEEIIRLEMKAALKGRVRIPVYTPVGLQGAAESRASAPGGSLSPVHVTNETGDTTCLK